MNGKLTKLFSEFLESEQSSGIVLIFSMLAAIAAANSPFGNVFSDLWHAKAGFTMGSAVSLRLSLEHWINDGLMAFFFLLVGLEIEREIFVGELSGARNATLPIFAAIGGLATPALIHFLLNRGTVTQAGIAIPMATDIAFALGVLALLGSRIPASLKIFLTALAIIDDLGAIIIIALFYVGEFSFFYLGLALGVFAALVIANRLGMRRLPFYLIPGCVMWYFMLKSGIHATIAGVLLAFAIPFAGGGEDSPSYKLQHFLHKPVALFIMPLFALANTGIVLNGNWLDGLVTPNSLGIISGLFLGKPLGITLFSALAVKLGLSRLPSDVSWRHLIGVGFLGGIGLTMSVFITLLAFDNSAIIQSSKISILLAALVSGCAGSVILFKPSVNSSRNSN